MDKDHSEQPLQIWSRNNLVAIVLLLITLILPLIGKLAGGINWGVTAPSYLPILLYYIWITLTIILLVMIPFRPGKGIFSGIFTRYLWGDRKYWGQIIFPIVIMLIFAIFRFQAHLYGDGYLRVGNFAQKSKPIFRWFEWGSTVIPFIPYYIIHSLGISREAAAIWGYQLVAILSGGFFWIIALRISELVSERPPQRLLFLGLIFFSGTNLLFFGLVETTPILLPLTAVFIYLLLLLKHSPNRKTILLLWGTVAAGLILNMLFSPALIPAIYVTVRFLLKNRKYSRLAALVAALLAAIIAVSMVYLLADSDIAVANRFLFFSGKSPETNYGLFSKAHLLDLANLFYLIVPIVLIGLYLGGRILGKLFADEFSLPLIILMISQVALLFILDPKNGMARDIHIFGFLMIGAVFGIAYVSLRLSEMTLISDKILRRLLPAAILLILPIFIIHLVSSLTVRHIEDFLTYNESKNISALYAFRDYYFMAGNFSEADRRERQITGNAKGVLESQLVDDLFNAGRVDDAFTYVTRLVERDPYNPLYRLQRGNLYKFFRKLDQAEQEYKTALTLDPYRPETYHYLADFYRDLDRHDESYRYLSRAINFDPDNVMILTDLAAYYFRIKNFVKSGEMAEKAQSLDPEKPYPYLYKGLVAEKTGRYREAYDALGEFVKRGDGLPEFTMAQKKMNNIYLERLDSTGTQ